VFANAGTSVLNLSVAFEPSKLSFLVKVPWIAVPLELI
jgi:hypothetical protein